MQINPGQETVEKALEEALFRAGGISAENHEMLQKVAWSRAARTDKGVHAAGNVIALKMMFDGSEEMIQRVNSFLPPTLRVVSIFRSGVGFSFISALLFILYCCVLCTAVWCVRSTPSAHAPRAATST